MGRASSDCGFAQLSAQRPAPSPVIERVARQSYSRACFRRRRSHCWTARPDTVQSACPPQDYWQFVIPCPLCARDAIWPFFHSKLDFDSPILHLRPGVAPALGEPPQPTKAGTPRYSFFFALNQPAPTYWLRKLRDFDDTRLRLFCYKHRMSLNMALQDREYAGRTQTRDYKCAEGHPSSNRHDASV